MRHTVYLALGSNLGERRQNLEAAVRALAPLVQVSALSPIYQTPPWGYLDQDDFLNQVVCAETDLEPLELLTYLKDIETHMGREKTIRYGPRLIDVDILFYDDLVMDTPDLTVPHPQLHVRAFVLVPLADLAPALTHPRLKQTIADLLSEVDTTAIEPYP